MRDLLTEPILNALVSVYVVILPNAEQLFAQLSVRHVVSTAASHPGYHPAGKALTNLLKFASVHAGSLILPILFKSIDTKLNEISAAKSSLRACTVAYNATKSASAAMKALSLSPGRTSGSGGDEGGSSVPAPPMSPASDFSAAVLQTAAGQEAEAAELRRERGGRSRRRSRGGSYGGEGANVLVLGVLDYIPHKCVYDENIAECYNDEIRKAVAGRSKIPPDALLPFLSAVSLSLSVCLSPPLFFTSLMLIASFVLVIDSH